MNKKKVPQTTVRCAIYTRKSTEEGLEQEFNSLDAQRESGEAYIASQRHEGWTCLTEGYDDGGFTGGNMERPALRRLLADIEAGKVDLVCVYKVDRLSRSLLDFAKMMEVFENHRVSFVSVTQQFNTASSMGRLILNVLLSFAQFKREIISERTRDKIAAARRKGKWSGGMPLLGYDVRDSKLIINDHEAQRVRAVFQLYCDHQGLLPVVEDLASRRWVNKRWTTRKGRERGGLAFTRTSLYQLLTNVTYTGRVRHKDQTYAGEHEAIVDDKLWQQVQTLLQRNGRSGGASRNKFGALLKGLLHCTSCDCAMTPSHAKKGNRRYRYYVCSHASKQGWDGCPAKSIPAGEIERFVVEQIKCVGRDPELVNEVVGQAHEQGRQELADLEAERRTLDRDLAKWNTEVRGLVGASDPASVGRLADLQDRIRAGEQRVTEVREQAIALGKGLVDESTVAQTLALFDPVWESLNPIEQSRVLSLLVDRIDYDGANGQVSITFHPTGIQSLADQLAHQKEKRA